MEYQAIIKYIIEMITKETFEEYCRTNNLRYKFEKEHEQWIDIYPISETYDYWNIDGLLSTLCYYGYIETIKWLLTSEKINIHANSDLAFRASCHGGFIEVAKMLLEISEKNKTIINIHACDEDAFVGSCRYGKIEVAKWLIEISKKSGKMINIHADYDMAFIWSCHKENIKIAKWLIEISKEIGEKINIHAYESAFEKSVYYGQQSDSLCESLCFQHYFAQSAK